MRLLFLDCDGVLNAHDRRRNGYCGLHPEKLDLLDGIVGRTGCRIVLASAWRYLILNGDMTLGGFRSLMRTHGASKAVAEALWGHLPADADVNDPHDRGKLAAAYLTRLPLPLFAACALDDLLLGYAEHGIPQVVTDGSVGLTEGSADMVVRILRANATGDAP